MTVLLGILAALTFGVSDFLSRFSSQEVGFKNSLFWMLTIGGSFYLIVTYFLIGDLSFNAIGLSNSFLAGVLIMFGLLCLYRGLQMGPVSIVASICAINPLFVFFIRFVLGSQPTLIQWIATIVVIVGAVLVSISADSFNKSMGMEKKQIRESVIVAFMSSVMLALGLIFLQESSNTLSALEAVVYTRFFSLFSLAFLLLFLKSKIFITRKALPILFAQGILESTGNFCIAAAYAFDKVSIAVVISSGFGLVTVLLAKVVLKEKISLIQSVGIFFTFAGVIGLTI